MPFSLPIPTVQYHNVILNRLVLKVSIDLNLSFRPMETRDHFDDDH